MDTNLGQVELVKDINPGVSDFSPRYQAPLNPNKPYSPPPAQVPNSSFPNSLVEFNDKLYFSADDGKNGRELFISDGTAEDTQLVKDIRPGVSNYGYGYSSSPSDFVEFNDKLYFRADDGVHGSELYVSDGSAEGTELLADLYPGEDNYGYNNGSFPSNLAEFNDKLYFSANDGVHGNELFVSDGTAEGTQLLVDLYPGKDNYGNSNGSYPSNLAEFNDKLYFSANDGVHGNELFVSDGTAEGTQLLVDLSPGENNYGQNNSSYPSNLAEFNDKLYFSANDGVHGSELFVSDGTAEGTKLLVDLYLGTNNNSINGSYPGNLTEFNGKLYFTADDGVHGNELFVTDGTTEGTQLFADIRPGAINDNYINGSYPSNLVEFKDNLYFTADDGEHGYELFVTDGTTEGTQLVADINPGLNNYSYPNSSFASSLTVVGDELFFAADNGATGTELFKLTVNDLTESSPIEIVGSDLADSLLGSDRSEQIQTLSGQDIIDSFGGDDVIEGGSDNDIFVLRSGDGSDTILDFNLGGDRFGLADGLQFEDLSFADNTIFAGAEVLASLDGVNAEQLSSTDFSAV